MSFAPENNEAGHEDVTADFTRSASTSYTQTSTQGKFPSAGRSDVEFSPSSSASQHQSGKEGKTEIASIDFVSSSPAANLETDYEAVKKLEEGLLINIDDTPRLPNREDFPQSLNVRILETTGEPVEHCIILLHDIAKDKDQLLQLAKSLQKDHAQSAFILLQGPFALGDHGYHWADPKHEGDESFIHASKIILECVITDVLVNKCNFQPQRIVILGRGQGGTAALAVAASWTETEFGGVVSIGGPLPAYIQRNRSSKAKTPALILRDSLIDNEDVALQEIEATFIYSDNDILADEPVSASSKHLKPFLRFLAHRLRQEEWTKQAVISFGRIILGLKYVNTLI